MIAEIQGFLDRGGPVLLLIAVTTFFMWALILERLFYFHVAHKAVAKDAVEEWQSRSDRKSTMARWVRDKIVSEVRQKTENNIILAKATVALAPLLGLLGTVTGMVTVFDIMALTDGADAQAMAGGVSRATIPTMAGMVVSITGIPFASGMMRKANRLVQAVDDDLEIG